MIGRNQVVGLLRAQVEDLSRFHFLIEAQFAVLAMENVDLLDTLGREADRLVADIERRDAEVTRWAAAPGDPPIPSQLKTLVLQAAERAGQSVLRLADRMRTAHQDQGRLLSAAEGEWSRLSSGYARPGIAPAPVLVDRTG